MRTRSQNVSNQTEADAGPLTPRELGFSVLLIYFQKYWFELQEVEIEREIYTF